MLHFLPASINEIGDLMPHAQNNRILIRIGTGTKLHLSDGERAYCNYDGSSRKTRGTIVDEKHLTKQNACSKCFRHFTFDA